MADPSVTYNTAGNAQASASCGASGTKTFTVDFSTAAYGGWVQVWNVAGTVAATAGLQVQVFPAGDSTPGYDTIPSIQFIIPSVTSTTNKRSFFLTTGKYSIVLTNLDATNAVTVEATSNPVI